MSQLYRSTFSYMGKQYEKTNTKSQREADRKADKLKQDLEDGNIGISKQMRVTVSLQACRHSDILSGISQSLSSIIVLELYSNSKRNRIIVLPRIRVKL